jgi:hypothetical protein
MQGDGQLHALAALPLRVKKPVCPDEHKVPGPPGCAVPVRRATAPANSTLRAELTAQMTETKKLCRILANKPGRKGLLGRPRHTGRWITDLAIKKIKIKLSLVPHTMTPL